MKKEKSRGKYHKKGQRGKGAKGQRREKTDILFNFQARFNLALIALSDIRVVEQVKMLNMICFCLDIPLRIEQRKAEKT
jgi:hypothetical protein